MNRRRTLLLPFVLTAAGCGGGGGDPPAAVQAPTQPATAPASAPVDTGPRADLPQPLAGVLAAQPLVVFGDSMAARLAAALAQTFAVDVTSRALGGSVSAAAVQQIATFPAQQSTAIIWAGHNDYADPAQVLAAIAETVARVGHQRFVVLTLAFEDMPSQRIGGSTRSAKLQINAALIAAYPGQVIDAPTLLTSWGNPRNPTDAADMAAGLTPSSLRDDAIHVSAQAAGLLARETALLIRGAGW